MPKSRKVLIAYVPVIHEGYRIFFEKYGDSELLILGKELLSQFDNLARGKDIRMLPPEEVVKLVSAWQIFNKVSVVDAVDLGKLADEDVEIVANKDEVAETILSKYLQNKKITWDTTFLRWGNKNTSGETVVTPNQKISREGFDKKIIKLATKESQKSVDWWRKIGAVLVKNNKIVISKHNEYVPGQNTPYYEGDPRINFTAGVRSDLSLVLHAEAAIVAEAAKKGISLDGASLYCTTFPCPPCAKQVAFSGIKKLYYSQGYAVLDGERILKEKGVEIIFVDWRDKR